MGKLARAISNWFKDKHDQMAGLFTDPERDTKIAIEDSKRLVEAFTEKVARLMAETKKLKKLLVDAEADVEKWRGIAVKAAEARDEGDARTALTRKAAAVKRVETLEAEVAQNEEVTEKLRAQIADTKARIDQAEADRARLVARLEGTQIRKDAAKAGANFGDTSNPLAALDDLERAVKNSEAEAEAWEELLGEDSEGEVLETKYNTENDAIEAELAELMKGKK
ncbi:MAG: PspA/IM30 family protein [Lentisphaeria bacterium]|nr:PspA/IM30 family protein [Lentisphaeria bacterium]